MEEKGEGLHDAVIYDALNEISDKFKMSEKFEDQRRNIGKAYGIAGKIRESSKDGIYWLKMGELTKAQICADDIKKQWLDLIRLDLPKDLAWQHQSEAGQEMVEFIYIIILYSYAEGRLKEIKFPSHEDLMVSMPTWLAGVGDAVTELGKLMLKKLLDRKLSIDERVAIIEYYLDIYKQIYDFLEKLENVYGLVINNSRRRGYGNSFRGLVQRISKFIEREEQKLSDIFSQKAGNEKLEALIQSLVEKNK